MAKTNDKPVKIAFHFQSNNTGASAYTLAIQPAGMGTRVSGIADSFELYRVTALKFRLLPSATVSGTVRPTTSAAGWYAGVTDTVPSTVTSIAENTESVLLAVWATVPTEWCRVGKVSLAGYCPWYKTIQGTPDVAEEIQGNIYVAAGSTDSYVIEVRGVIEFKGPVNPSSTPMARQMAEMRKEKDRLMKILATPLSNPTNSKP